MAKIELNSVTSGYNLSAINDNFQKIEDELKNKVMYVDEVSPMERPLDMNGEDILNTDTLTVNQIQLGSEVLVEETISELNAARDEAVQSASNASSSAASALSSENTASSAALSASLSAQAANEVAQFLDGNPALDSSQIAFQQAGGVARTAESKLRESVSVDDYSDVNAAMAAAISDGKRVRFSASATVRIPEDAGSLQEAFDAIDPNLPPDVTVTVRISSGHQIAAGLLVRKANFGNVEITSVDAVVSLAPDFVGVAGGDAFSTSCLMVANTATAPRWNLVVDIADAVAVCGLVYEQSNGFVAGSKGVTNAGGYGLYVKNQSKVFATNAVFTGAGYGNRVTVNSMLNAPQANFSGTKNELYVGSNRAANLDVSRGSLVYVTGAPGAETNLTGGQGRGLAVRRSYVSATSVNVSDVAQAGLAADLGAVVAFNGSIANNCGTDGVVSSGAFVSFNDSGSAINNGRYNLYADSGGRIMARNATLTGGGVNGVIATNGGEITIPGADCRRNGVSDQTTDITATNGGYISAVGALGGTGATPLSNDIGGTIIKGTANVRIRTAGTNVNSTVDFDFPSVTSANADVRFWRNTNTTGSKRLLFQRGDGTATLDAQIGVGGAPTFFNSGTVVVGSAIPNSKAILALESTVAGFLLPRMTTAQRDAITGPPQGLMIFNTTTDTLQVRTSAAWVDLSAAV